MKQANLERGKEIEQELFTVNHNLAQWKNVEENPTARDLMWHGTGISNKANEEMRAIAIKALTNKRRSLQRQFNKL